VKVKVKFFRIVMCGGAIWGMLGELKADMVLLAGISANTSFLQFLK